jgi:stress-induced morphogen
MAVSAQQIEARIHAALPDAQVTVRDTTGGGDHWSAVVVTAAFEGKSLVERHRLIYGALGDWMRAEIHALALTTQTPEEGSRK